MSETAPFPNPTPVRVRTTRPILPFPPSASRPSVQTGQLTVRPFAASDLEALHALLSEPAGAAQSSTGRPAGSSDAATTETRARLDDYVRGAASYQCAAVLRDTGALVGAGGVRSSGSSSDNLKLKLFFGWPEIGYGVAGQHWGQGLATEFLAAWLELYFGRDVPREEVEVEVDARSLSATVGDGDGDVGEVRTVPERVTAMVEAGNVASRRVLEKNGARPFVEWTLRDPREGFAGREVQVVGYVLERPATSDGAR